MIGTITAIDGSPKQLFVTSLANAPNQVILFRIHNFGPAKVELGGALVHEIAVGESLEVAIDVNLSVQVPATESSQHAVIQWEARI